jgi:hypothetical protein
MLKTPFWKKAAASLAPEVRARNIRALEQAERWELALDGAIEVWSQFKAAFAHQPRRAH